MKQNRRWENLNEANLVLSDVFLKPWKSIARDDALKMNWGYDPWLYGVDDDFDKLVLPYYLIIRDGESGNKVEGTNPVFSMEDVLGELKRVGYKGSPEIGWQFRPVFHFENTGKMEAKNVRLRIEARIGEGDWVQAFQSQDHLDLPAGKQTTVYFEIGYTPKDKSNFEMLSRITQSYETARARRIERKIDVRWSSKGNFWSYAG